MVSALVEEAIIRQAKRVRLFVLSLILRVLRHGAKCYCSRATHYNIQREDDPIARRPREFGSKILAAVHEAISVR